jgi:hypothetical protein
MLNPRSSRQGFPKPSTPNLPLKTLSLKSRTGNSPSWVVKEDHHHLYPGRRVITLTRRFSISCFRARYSTPAFHCVRSSETFLGPSRSPGQMHDGDGRGNPLQGMRPWPARTKSGYRELPSFVRPRQTSSAPKHLNMATTWRVLASTGWAPQATTTWSPPSIPALGNLSGGGSLQPMCAAVGMRGK